MPIDLNEAKALLFGEEPGAVPDSAAPVAPPVRPPRGGLLSGDRFTRNLLYRPPAPEAPAPQEAQPQDQPSEPIKPAVLGDMGDTDYEFGGKPAVFGDVSSALKQGTMEMVRGLGLGLQIGEERLKNRPQPSAMEMAADPNFTPMAAYEKQQSAPYANIGRGMERYAERTLVEHPEWERPPELQGREWTELLKDPKTRGRYLARVIFENLPNMGGGIVATAATLLGTRNPAAAGLVGYQFSKTLEGGFSFKDLEKLTGDRQAAAETAETVGVINGILEFAPIGKLFAANPLVKRKFIKALTEEIATKPFLRRAAVAGATQFAAESSTEGLQQVVSNVGKQFYNENQHLLEGVGESAFIGGLLGGAAGITGQVGPTGSSTATTETGPQPVGVPPVTQETAPPPPQAAPEHQAVTQAISGALKSGVMPDGQPFSIGQALELRRAEDTVSQGFQAAVDQAIFGHAAQNQDLIPVILQDESIKGTELEQALLGLVNGGEQNAQESGTGPQEGSGQEGAQGEGVRPVRLRDNAQAGLEAGAGKEEVGAVPEQYGLIESTQPTQPTTPPPQPGRIIEAPPPVPNMGATPLERLRGATYGKPVRTREMTPGEQFRVQPPRSGATVLPGEGPQREMPTPEESKVVEANPIPTVRPKPMERFASAVEGKAGREGKRRLVKVGGKWVWEDKARFPQKAETTYGKLVDELKGRHGADLWRFEASKDEVAQLNEAEENVPGEIKEQYRKRFGDMPIVLSKAPRSDQDGRFYGAMITQSSKEPGKYQLTYFDQDGFSSDTQHDTENRAINEAYREGFELFAPQNLEELSGTERFIEGNRKTEEVQRFNEEQIGKDKVQQETPVPASFVQAVDSAINERERSNILIEEGSRRVPGIRLQDAEEAGRWAYMVDKGEAEPQEFDAWKQQAAAENRIRQPKSSPANAPQMPQNAPESTNAPGPVAEAAPTGEVPPTVDTGKPGEGQRAKEPWEMTKAERTAEIKQLKEENQEILATPLASEGSISPAQIGVMSKNQHRRWQANAQKKMSIEAKIRELGKSDEELREQKDSRDIESAKSKLRQLDSVDRFLSSFKTKTGKTPAKYQRRLDESTRERDEIYQRYPDLQPQPSPAPPSVAAQTPPESTISESEGVGRGVGKKALPTVNLHHAKARVRLLSAKLQKDNYARAKNPKFAASSRAVDGWYEELGYHIKDLQENNALSDADLKQIRRAYDDAYLKQKFGIEPQKEQATIETARAQQEVLKQQAAKRKARQVETAKTLEDWIVAVGGLRPNDPSYRGELRDVTRILGKGGKIVNGVKPGFFNSASPWTMDTLAQEAKNEGFISDNDDNTLMAAIEADLRARSDKDPIKRVYRQSYRESEEYLDLVSQKEYGDFVQENYSDEEVQDGTLARDEEAAKADLEAEITEEVGREREIPKKNLPELLNFFDTVSKGTPAKFSLTSPEYTDHEKMAELERQGIVRRPAKDDRTKAVFPKEGITPATGGKQKGLFGPEKGENLDLFDQETTKASPKSTDVRFSQSTTPTAKSLSPASIRMIAKSVTKEWKNVADVQVVRTVDEIPEAGIRNAINPNMRVKGVFAGRGAERKIYLVASNLGGRHDVQVTLLEETLGHDGLRQAFGDKLNDFLDTVYAEHGDKMRDLAKRYRLDTGTEAGQREIADEWVAKQIATDSLPARIWARIIAAVRGWVRKVMPGMKISVAEAKGLAQKAIMEGPKMAGENTADARLSAIPEPAPPTDSPAFKKWFGDSKVVDEDGKPLVVYHGSKWGSPNVYESKKEYAGVGFFTDSQEIAKAYKEKKEPIPGVPPEKWAQSTLASTSDIAKGNVDEVFLKIENPIDESITLEDVLGSENEAEEYRDEYRYLPAQMFTSSVEENSDIAIIMHFSSDSPKFKEYLQSKGYDGFIFNDLESGGVTFVPFSSTQIKSAIGNVGTYDPNNPDIRFNQDEKQRKITIASFLKDTQPAQPKAPIRNVNEGKEKEYSKVTGADPINEIFPEDVAESIKKSRGIKKPGAFTNVKEKMKMAGVSLIPGNQFPEIPKSQPFMHALEVLRHFKEVSQYAKSKAAQDLEGIFKIKGFTPKDYDIFSMNIILDDLLYDATTPSRPLYERAQRGELPFGFTSIEQIQESKDKADGLLEASPRAKQALANRQSLMLDLRKRLVKENLLPESVLEDPRYFHHQVLEFMAIKQQAEMPKQKAGTSSKDFRVHKKGYQYSRKGSIKDYNTDYLQSEFEVLAHGISQLEAKSDLDEIGKTYNKAKEAKKLAKTTGTIKWQDEIKNISPLPGSEGWVIWRPKPGSAFYVTNSITDKILEQVLSGEHDLADGDVRKVLARGFDVQWALPKELAATMDSINTFDKGSAIGHVAETSMNWWKRWILINPMRVVKYNLNNLSGDLDIVIAYNPKILKYAKQATQDLIKWHYKRNMSDELRNEFDRAERDAVIGSGMTVHDIPDISDTDDLQKLQEALYGKRPNIIKQFWRGSKNFTTFRENILRLSAYRFFTDALARGEKNIYGASKPEMVDAIKDNGRKAALLARELIGDYGGLSEGGQFLRRKMIPFYSWLEINAPRYVRMVRNIPVEGPNKGRGLRVGAVLAKKAAGGGAWLAVRMMMLSAAVMLYNRLVWPDEDDELGETGRRQLHLILGRRSDGTIMTVRFQGAFSDALSWFGLEDAVNDWHDLVTKKKTVWQQLAEIPLGAASNIIQGVRPDIKMPAELITGKTTYPEFWSPRPIRDKWEHLSRMFSIDPFYKKIAGRPMQKGSIASQISRDLLGSIVYTADPGEIAYHEARSLVYKFLDQQNVDRPSAEPTSRSNALYYYRQSIKFGDAEAAARYLKRYVELGGTIKGMKISIKKAAPLAGLPLKYRAKFNAWMTSEDAEMIKTGEAWYRSTYLGEANSGTRK